MSSWPSCWRWRAGGGSRRARCRRRPRDATAWFDLGRAQESAGVQDAALQSYARALSIDPQFAAAHLRLGSIYANESRTREALASFAEAERLYRSAANTEGEAEVLLRRGSLHDSLNESQGVFAFVIDPMPADCVPPAGSTIDKVTVTYSDGKKVSLKAGARKAGNAKRLATKIRPHALLARDATNSRRLSGVVGNCKAPTPAP